MAFGNLFKYIGRVGLKEAIRTLRMTNELKIGVLRGQDAFGNKYYEDLEEQTGRQRWVQYKNKSYWDASQIPPEWHPWLHHMSDETPKEKPPTAPKYGMPFEQNKTFTDKAYYPPGHVLNKEHKQWTSYEKWTAPKSSSS